MNRSMPIKLLPLLQSTAHKRGLIFGGIILSALLFVARKRSSWWTAWAMAFLLSTLLGLYIVWVTSLHRDYLPSSWTPSWSSLIIPATFLFSAVLMLWAERRELNAKANSMD